MELKIAPPTVPTVAGNVSAVCPSIPLGTCVSLFSYLFEISPHFLVTQKQQGILLLQDACNSKRNSGGSQRKGSKYWYYCNTLHKVQIISPKDATLRKTLPMLSFILATCVWRYDYIQYYECIPSLICFSEFKSSGLSL